MVDDDFPMDVERLQELRQSFIIRSRNILDRITNALEQLEQDPANIGTLKNLLELFHQLAVAAKKYRFARMSSFGFEAEQQCGVLMKTGKVPGASHLRRWRLLLEGLRSELDYPGVSSQPISDLIGPPPQPYILIVHSDPVVHRTFGRLAEREGIAIRSVVTRADAMGTLQQRIPVGVITERQLPDGSGLELASHLRSLPGGEAPAVLMIEDRPCKFSERVQAIRSGVNACFEKPVDWEALMRRLEHLLEKAAAEAPRILCVEDNKDQASLTRTLLESAGYRVSVCNDPIHFEARMASFRPDFALVEVQLPGIDGYELVKYLRQDERYATVPVVFLIAYCETKDRIESLRAGGDDCLLKPVAPELLLACVAARIEQARFLKRLLERDGLTGLLTRTSFLERAKTLMAAKRRQQHSSAVLAMIDLDHFKSVNDRYGHIVGDQVLGELAALLRRRLRRSDLLGRYGGEEFAVILDNVDDKKAARVLGELLRDFSAIDHRADDGTTFHVTFSTGVAKLDIAGAMELEQWKRAADTALYSAKANGRSVVVVATRENPLATPPQSS